MENVVKLKLGIYAFGNTIVDLTNALMPSNHPLVVCDDNSPQFADTLIRIAKNNVKRDYLNKDVSGVVVRNVSHDDCLVVYRSGKTHIESLLHPVTEKSIYGGKHKSEFLKEGCIVITWDELNPLIKEVENAKYLNSDFEEITEEQFNDALEVLPPQKWVRHQYGSIFRMSEYMTSNITAHYVNHRNKFFYALRRSTTSYDDILNEVNLLIK